MNTIRIKIIVSWLLFLAWSVLLYFHYVAAWFLYLPMILLRQCNPKAAQLPRRLGYWFSGGFILFLLLLLVDAFYPFPPVIIATGKIVGILLLIPFICYVVYLDYKTFRLGHDARA